MVKNLHTNAGEARDASYYMKMKELGKRFEKKKNSKEKVTYCCRSWTIEKSSTKLRELENSGFYAGRPRGVNAPSSEP